MQSLDFEKDEVHKIFQFLDTQKKGYLDAYEIQALLVGQAFVMTHDKASILVMMAEYYYPSSRLASMILQMILGVPPKREILKDYVVAIDKEGQHMIDFTTFITWWQG